MVGYHARSKSSLQMIYFRVKRKKKRSAPSMTIDKKFEFAVGIVRVSTLEQEISVEAQKQSIEDWCSEQGLKLLAIL